MKYYEYKKEADITMKKKFNIYDMVNDKIIAMLDKGVVPWQRPWHGGAMCISRVTGKPYSFLNQILLSPNFDGTLESLNSGEYATMQQINKEGGRVNKGAKSYQVVFWKLFPVKEKNPETNKEEEKTVPVLRYFNVFNIKDTTLEPKFDKKQIKVAEPDTMAEEILTNYWTTEGIHVERNQPSNKAAYSPSMDRIILPRIDQFEETAEYYSTAFHESVHSTGHKDRLDRGLNTVASFGSETYSKEELVAEIGASALVSICGLETTSSLRNNVAYIKGWRDAIAKDNKLIISAAGKAEKAIERIMNPVKK